MQVQHFKCSRSRYIYIYEKLCSSVVILIHPNNLCYNYLQYLSFQSYVGITQINIISQWWSVMSCNRRHMWGSLAELDSHKMSYTQQHQCTQKSRLIIIKVQAVIEPLWLLTDTRLTDHPPLLTSDSHTLLVTVKAYYDWYWNIKNSWLVWHGDAVKDFIEDGVVKSLNTLYYSPRKAGNKLKQNPFPCFKCPEILMSFFFCESHAFWGDNGCTH